MKRSLLDKLAKAIADEDVERFAVVAEGLYDGDVLCALNKACTSWKYLEDIYATPLGARLAACGISNNKITIVGGVSDSNYTIMSLNGAKFAKEALERNKLATLALNDSLSLETFNIISKQTEIICCTQET